MSAMRRLRQTLGSTTAIVLLVATIAFAQVWYPANQKTIAWDPVTTLADGSPLPAGSSIQYRVFIKPQGATTQTEAGVTANTTFTVTLTAEGKYFVGLQTERKDATGAVVATSPIGWSSDAAIVQGGATFGLTFYQSPKQAGGLRPVGD